jgi:hypothetical protein
MLEFLNFNFCWVQSFTHSSVSVKIKPSLIFQCFNLSVSYTIAKEKHIICTFPWSSYNCHCSRGHTQVTISQLHQTQFHRLLLPLLVMYTLFMHNCTKYTRTIVQSRSHTFCAAFQVQIHFQLSALCFLMSSPSGGTFMSRYSVRQSGMEGPAGGVGQSSVKGPVGGGAEVLQQRRVTSPFGRRR